MSIYARYFDQDVLVRNYDELMEFLNAIPDIPMTERLAEDIHSYMESDIPYPKRYKIRPRVYFILIKTDAQTMEDFKNNRKQLSSPDAMAQSMNNAAEPLVNKKDIKTAQLAEKREGWYLGTLLFKRVIQIATTQKCYYQDTTFQAYVRANSGQECYNRIIKHLKGRAEVDKRSQLPSAKGNNFTFEYVGDKLPGNNEAK